MKCQRCESDQGYECIDPYVEEIYGEIRDVILCPDCYYESCMDI